MTKADAEPRPEGDDGAAPRVPLPAAGAPIIMLVGLLVLAVGLFLFLEGRRRPVTRETTVAAAPIAPAPPLRFPPTPSEPPPPPPPPPPEIRYVTRPGPAAESVIRYVERPAPAALPTPAPITQGRLTDPALVIDLAEADGEGPVRAARLRNRGALVPQGALIPAILETPIDTARAGPVRAIVSEDTRGFDGARVLIPKGSRLVGEVRDGGGSGRAVVNWDRLVRPDGVAIRINAPATDALGGAGVAGEVNNHSLARISGVALQTAFTIGANLASQPRRGSVIVNTSGQALGNIGQALVPRSELKPSVRVKKGAAITIFVTRDLDFGGAVTP